MTITARFPGCCSQCGGRIQAGEQIEWAKGRPTRHATCPTATKRPAEPDHLIALAPPRATGRNRKPEACGRCGDWVKAGEGQLVRCVEDSGCLEHHDYSGWHVYCLDEGDCVARRVEARAAAEARGQALREALAARRALEAVLRTPETYYGGPCDYIEGERIKLDAAYRMVVGAEVIMYIQSCGGDVDEWRCPQTPEVDSLLAAWRAAEAAVPAL